MVKTFEGKEGINESIRNTFDDINGLIDQKFSEISNGVVDLDKKIQTLQENTIPDLDKKIQTLQKHR